MHQALLALIGPSSRNHVGLILSERLINMPVQIAPPMYRLLSDEMRWAIEANEPYRFSHLVCISRTYRVSPDDDHTMEGIESTAPPAKRQRSKATPTQPSTLRTFPYHPEDEIWEELASHTIDYSFTHHETRDADAVGADTAGRLMLLPAEQFDALVTSMSEKYALSS